MKVVSIEKFFDRLFSALLGAAGTLFLLTQAGRGNFWPELGWVGVALAVLVVEDVWRRWRSDRQGSYSQPQVRL